MLIPVYVKVLLGNLGVLDSNKKEEGWFFSPLSAEKPSFSVAVILFFVGLLQGLRHFYQIVI